MTVSSLSPTRRSRSRPSSTSFRSERASSRYLRISDSASSRPSMARFRAASAVLRSSCLDMELPKPCWLVMLLNWAILSWILLSRSGDLDGELK